MPAPRTPAGAPHTTVQRTTERQETKSLSPALLLTLGLLSAVAPFATDLYLPAMPQIVDDLSTTTSGAQFSLTAFLIGAAVGQLLFGPLSDRIGRRRPLLIGTALYLLASVAAALSPSVTLLVVFRLVQGVSGAAGMVIGRAVVTDRYRGTQAAQAMSLMMVVGGVAPVIAPFVGSTLADPIGWRGLLWIVAGLGLVALVCILAVIPETHPHFTGKDAAQDAASAEPAHTTEGAHTTRVTQTTGSGLTSRAFLAPVLAFAFGFATMMAYISASPFLYQKYMGMGTVQYGLAFAANALVLMVVSIVSAKLALRYRVRTLTRVGLGVNLLGSLLFGLLVVVDAPAPSLMVPLLLVVGSLGLVLGNATSLALSAVPGASGAGSAILGFLQFGLAGVVAPLVGVNGELDPAPLAVVMLVASVIASVAVTVSPAKAYRL
ncbi:multidrug effflux MFS transporter [uncultured Corynebacterium sp.]|uniref:multidrug effflux MFS transporter n=1 Tax=uncultured Corynebacterium sp. TaxID=159447 RepID=UPI0025DC3FAC|nr:multidrug effflux MFS transporter [uncultured Corynebacterium sp.]